LADPAWTPEERHRSLLSAYLQKLAEIQRIANESAAPTFENTIVAMEKSGRMLDRVSTTFFNIVGANTNPTLDKVQAAVAPELASHQDAIFLNPKLFARVKAVYDQRDKLHLDPESQQLLKIYYRQFVHAGANLSDADKDKLNNAGEDQAGTDPINPDTDGDGIKDGDEKAGEIVSFDGTTLTLRLFGGQTISGTVDENTWIDCGSADSSSGGASDGWWDDPSSHPSADEL